MLFLTLCFSESDWRFTFVVLLLTFVDYCCLLLNVNDSCNAPMFYMYRRIINFYDDDDNDDDDDEML